MGKSSKYCVIDACGDVVRIVCQYIVVYLQVFEAQGFAEA